jgi:hypothetical protein
MTEKNKAATRSAAEAQLEGCPLPASLVARTLLMRSWVALLCKAVRSSDEATEPAITKSFQLEIAAKPRTLSVTLAWKLRTT